MKPLIVLLVAFAIAFSVTFLTGSANYALSARIALAAMLLFTALGHVLYTQGMVLMMPDFIPFKKELVYLTGLVEVAAAAGLLIPATRSLTGWLLLLFFVLILPANIRAATRHINYQTATPDGPGLSYLWFRIPFQILLLLWTYLCAIKA